MGWMSDSMNYTNNLLNGKSYKYTQDGQLRVMRTNYYGLEVGDFSFYDRGKIQQYDFIDFENETLVKCTYDSAGMCDSLYFNAMPVLRNMLKEGRSINLFFISPHPPDFETKYMVGIKDENGMKKREFHLRDDSLFLDTVLPTPPKKWVYYVSINYKNISSDSTVNYYKEYKLY
jgi:hypothetical protein